MDFPPIRVPQDRPMPIEVFVSRYFDRHLRDVEGNLVAIPPFHREIYYILTHPDDYAKSIIVAPRGFSKSTIVMLLDTLYDAVCTRQYRDLLLISASQALVRGWLRKIKFELENNELLIRDFQLQDIAKISDKWTEDSIELPNGVTINGIGVDGASRGLHPQKVKIDDIETDESARSEVQCEKIETWLKATIEPMLIERKPVINWCGTLLTPEAVLCRALKGDGWDESWFRRAYSASINDKGEPAWPGHSIWPQRFSDEWLTRKERSIGWLNFMAEYMNQPQFGGNPVLRQEWIKYYTAEEQPEFMYKVLAVDPAIAENEQADYTALVCLGADVSPDRPSNRVFCLDADEGKWDINSTVRRIYDMWRAYHPDMILVESVAYQKALKQVLEREARDWGVFLPVVEVQPDKDKRRRLIAVSSLIESGNVFFRKTQDRLTGQLVSFTGKGTKKKDLVDAFAYALKALMEHWQFVDSENSYEKRDDFTPAIAVLGY